MLPSSFMISQMTPAGSRPAMHAISTAASVWPARISVPPGRAANGKTWPGVTTSVPVLSGFDGDGDRVGAVARGDAADDAVRRIDGHCERGLVALFVGHGHHRQAEPIDLLRGEREADQPAGVAHHEGQRLRGGELGGDDEIALVLAVLVIDQDEHAAGLGFGDQLGGGADRFVRAGAGEGGQFVQRGAAHARAHAVSARRAT